jgi:hypothetical protein
MIALGNFIIMGKMKYFCNEKLKNVKINTRIQEYGKDMIKGYLNRIKTVFKASVYLILFNFINILLFTLYCIITTNSRLFYSTINFPLISITIITFWCIDIFVYLVSYID